MLIKKKLRLIIGSLNVGGTEKQVVKLVNSLTKKGWEIELFTIKEKGLLAKFLNKKIKIKNLNINSNLKILNLLKLLFELYKLFKKDPYTLTHFFLPQAYIAGMTAAIIAKSKSKLIMSRRSLNFYQKKILFIKTIEKFLHKRVNKILVNSIAIKKQLIAIEDVKEDKVKIIYNGIETGSKKRIRKSNSFNIVIVANLIPYKNNIMLFNSLNLIKSKLPSNWKLYCIGRDDGIKKNLLSLSKKFKIYNRIKWIETINVEKILYNCDLGILCSKEEGFPNAILEYFKFKLPVISTNVGGCKEIIKNKKNGILVKNNNFSQLSEAIIYFLKNKNEAKKMVIESSKTIKNFSIKKMVNEHEKEYLKCLNS